MADYINRQSLAWIGSADWSTLAGIRELFDGHPNGRGWAINDAGVRAEAKRRLAALYAENPDTGAVGTGRGHEFVATIPSEYWKLDAADNQVIEMSDEEKKSVDLRLLEDYKQGRIGEMEAMAVGRAGRDRADFKAAEAAIRAATSRAEVDAVTLSAER